MDVERDLESGSSGVLQNYRKKTKFSLCINNMFYVFSLLLFYVESPLGWRADRGGDLNPYRGSSGHQESDPVERGSSVNRYRPL